jgi:hypothetical protein
MLIDNAIIQSSQSRSNAELKTTIKYFLADHTGKILTEGGSHIIFMKAERGF